MVFFFSLFCDPIGENLLLFDVEMSLKHSHSELPDLTEKRKRGRKRKVPFKLVFFSLSSVTAATENFSDANKLGEGGFGPVYKVPTQSCLLERFLVTIIYFLDTEDHCFQGRLKGGHEVAVKRLSEKSGQGKNQFKTEAHLIARLQHKNLVRLLGCCVEKKEQILIYEYMSNKSLDFFLYGL